MLHDSPEFTMGRMGEMAVADWLQHRGWYVVPSYDYAGQDGQKAPRLQGIYNGYAIPDLDVARDGRRVWIEVKTKSEPTLYRKTNTFEHGICKRLYEHYTQVRSITGCPVWIVVYELSTNVLLGRDLADLGQPRIYEGNKMGRGGMVFWPRDSFRVIGQVNPKKADA